MCNKNIVDSQHKIIIPSNEIELDPEGGILIDPLYMASLFTTTETSSTIEIEKIEIKVNEIDEGLVTDSAETRSTTTEDGLLEQKSTSSPSLNEVLDSYDMTDDLKNIEPVEKEKTNKQSKGNNKDETTLQEGTSTDAGIEKSTVESIIAFVFIVLMFILLIIISYLLSSLF
mgnify:CR=1 FL=1